MFPRSETFKIGLKFSMINADHEDFYQTATLISLECDDEAQVRAAWQRADESYGFTTSHIENGEDDFTIIKGQFHRFWTLVQQHLLPDEQQSLWGWLNGVKPRDEEVEEALTMLFIHTMPLPE